MAAISVRQMRIWRVFEVYRSSVWRFCRSLSVGIWQASVFESVWRFKVASWMGRKLERDGKRLECFFARLKASNVQINRVAPKRFTFDDDRCVFIVKTNYRKCISRVSAWGRFTTRTICIIDYFSVFLALKNTTFRCWDSSGWNLSYRIKCTR